MYCKKCGTVNDDNAYKCVSCGELLQQVPAPAVSVPTYLVQSILVTMFCCLPFGIVAIVYAAQVSSRLQLGDVAGALDASNKAKMWSWLSFWLGFIPIILWLIAVCAGIASEVVQ
jgi:uncharacterized paraquat-inducible protein A